MYINFAYIFKYILSRCTGLPGMNFVCDCVNIPVNIVLQTISVKFQPKLIRQEHLIEFILFLLQLIYTISCNGPYFKLSSIKNEPLSEKLPAIGMLT